jgi:hypothetical protein
MARIPRSWASLETPLIHLGAVGKTLHGGTPPAVFGPITFAQLLRHLGSEKARCVVGGYKLGMHKC